MKRVKIFTSSYNTLEASIDEWIKKSQPDIISASSSVGTSGSGSTYYITTILYEDNTGFKI